MNRRISVPLPLALVLAGVAPVGVWLYPQDAGKAEPKVAIVDLSRVFESDALLAADIQAIKDKQKEYEAKIGEMREQHRRLADEREAILDRASESYVQAASRVVAKEQEIKAFAQGIQAYLEHEGDRCNLTAFKRYRAAIAKIASKRGLDAVLRVTDQDDKERSTQARLHAAELGLVLYHDPRLDITDQVIQLLKAPGALDATGSSGPAKAPESSK